MKGTFSMLFLLFLSTIGLAAGVDSGAFLQTYCISCHGPDKAKGKIRLDGLQFPITETHDAELWQRVLEALQFGEMPPDNAKTFPTREAARSIEKQIAQALAAHGAEVADKTGKEGYGNLVPHDLLFSPEERHRTVDVGARIWRVSPQTLEAKIQGTGLKRFQGNPFKHDKPNGNFRDFKGKYWMNSVVTEQLLDLAMQATETQLKKLLPKIESADNRAEAVRETLVQQFQVALHREPYPEDLARAEALMKKVDEEVGWPAGLQAALASVILLPEGIYRYEAFELAEASGKDGLVPLSRTELAHALVYSLTDFPPHRDQIRPFLDESKAAHSILLQSAKEFLAKNGRTQLHLLKFFREYFDYEKCQEVFKDKATQHHHDGPTLVKDLDKLVAQVIKEDRQVLKTLLTTREFYISNATALTWNQPPGWKVTDKPVTMPANQRLGILTHPAWLVAHSGNFDNDPIHRGLWIQRKLLGGNVPDVPITVDAQLPDEPTWTLRKRLAVTEVDQCYKCHSKMNPLGLPFERYDHYGRYRIFEFDQHVQTTGAFPHNGIPELNGQIPNPFEMIDKLADSTHVEQVFVRHAFRFFLGRNETLGDAKTLQDAHKAYVENNGSFKALVLSLMKSDSFVNRAK